VTRRASRGVTFIELLIVLALFGCLIYMVFLFVDRGITMYRESVDALEIRQQALVGLSRVVNELRESAQVSVHCMSTTAVPPDPVDGLVFSSTRDAAGVVQVDTTTGRVFWKKFVCYYKDVLSDGTPCIHRKEQLLTTLAEFPTAPSDVIPDPYGVSPVCDPAYFAAAALPKRLICKRISALEVKKEAELVSIRMEFDISGRYKHLVEVRTKVFPRQ
jgi:prepilin-type N-terminal cleavage/methylation domain-containing protein